jgi:hypothetical protein
MLVPLTLQLRSITGSRALCDHDVPAPRTPVHGGPWFRHRQMTSFPSLPTGSVRRMARGILSVLSSELKPLQFYGFFLPLISLLIRLGSQEEIRSTYRGKYELISGP